MCLLLIRSRLNDTCSSSVFWEKIKIFGTAPMYMKDRWKKQRRRRKTENTQQSKVVVPSSQYILTPFEMSILIKFLNCDYLSLLGHVYIKRRRGLVSPVGSLRTRLHLGIGKKQEKFWKSRHVFIAVESRLLRDQVHVFLWPIEGEALEIIFIFLCSFNKNTSFRFGKLQECWFFRFFSP